MPYYFDMSTNYRNYFAGETIFAQDEPGDCAYIVESGRVLISLQRDDQMLPILVVGQGEIFGEMAIIDRLPRSATAVALEDCRLCVVSRGSLDERVQRADPVVRLLLMMCIKRMRKMNSEVLIKTVDLEENQSIQDLNQMRASQEAVRAVKLEAQIAEAFKNGEFCMYYQPIVGLSTRVATGFEALIRWHSATQGALGPHMFMDALEESALMVPIGKWIIEQSLKDINTLRVLHKTNYTISINISARQLLEPDFVEHLESCRSSYKIRADEIKLEITERVLLQGEVALCAIESCRKLGYKVALDDFGTGYSSISYLREIELDVIKVDRAFTLHVLSHSKSKHITQSIMDLARALGLECIAEGVETEEVAKELVSMGCVLAQGYLFGKPEALKHYLGVHSAA